jgi:hypothetical protein
MGRKFVGADMSDVAIQTTRARLGAMGIELHERRVTRRILRGA